MWNKASRMAGILLGAVTAGWCAARASEGPARDMPGDDLPLAALVIQAQIYGSTPAKVERRELAREALWSRGEIGLRFLLDHAHLRHDGVGTLLHEAVRTRLAPEVVTPVLVEYLQAGPAVTRRLAAYYLGFFPAGDPEPLRAMLADEATAGAAARTLGKWGDTEAVVHILPMLGDPREPRRVIAVNALRDLGDPRAIEALTMGLDDPRFTVRKAAARALVTFGRAAEPALLEGLATGRDPLRRECIRTLGVVGSRAAIPALRTCLEDPNPHVRREAATALRAIAPRQAAKWIGNRDRP